MAKDWASRCAPERLGNPIGHDHAAQREVPARHALGEDDHVGVGVPALNAVPGAESSEAADHGVHDEQHVVAGAQRGDALDVARPRRIHAAGPDHGLEEERRDTLGADAGEQLLECLDRVVGNLLSFDLRAEAHTVGCDPAYRRAVAVRAVIAARPAHEERSVGLADLIPVATRQLGGGVDRVAAARCEKDARGHRRALREDVRQLKRRRAGEIAERGVSLDLAHLRGDRFGDLAPAVSDVGVPESGGGVEIAPALRIPHPDILAALDHELRAADRPHVGEGMPEPGVARHAFLLCARQEKTATRTVPPR